MSTTIERKNSKNGSEGGGGSEGMMDIGQHCSICRQLDFLPFVCPKCEKPYCNEHRIEYNTHECMISEANSKLQKLQEGKVDVSQMAKSKDLFPDLTKIREEAERRHQAEQGRKIGQRLTGHKDGDGKVLSSIEVAMLRLKKLLENSSSKKKTTGAASQRSFLGMNLMKSSSSSSSSNAARMLAMTQLKRSARGDNRISNSDRVYVWVSFNSDDDSRFNEKHAQFFSKKWPIGKMLDNSAELAKVKNLNNQVTDSTLKLAMFRKMRNGEKGEEGREFVYIPTSGRVEKEIKDGDEVYILRGQR